MSSTAVLRPGIALGRYPQREDLREGWLDRTAASLAGLVRQGAYGRSPGHRQFRLRLGHRLLELGAVEHRRHRTRRLDLQGGPLAVGETAGAEGEDEKWCCRPYHLAHVSR